MKYIKILFVFLIALNFGCASKSASYYYAQKQIEEGDINFHNTLRVDEYLNAFNQDWLKVPSDEEIILSIDSLSSKATADSNNSLVQIAVKTRGLKNEEARKPIGISFVIDVSGSMGGENIRDTKDALRNSIMELKNGDVVSLVTFNDKSQVIEPLAEINATTRQKLLEKIDNLGAGGGTNIESGLIAGYKQMSQFPRGISHRLLMLTDGQSTVDVKSPSQIAEKAAVEYMEGARISTIGLGFNVDEKLLRKIAEKGNGHYYFADTSKTLTRILREDLQTTIVPIAKDVNLTVSLGESNILIKAYGAEAINSSNGKINFSLGELNANDWRIMVLELNNTGMGKSDIKVEGTYFSLQRNEKNIILKNTEPFDRVESINPYVLRNSILFGNAETLIKASQLYEEGKSSQAIQILDLQLNNNNVLASINDSEMLRNERSTLLKTRNIIAKKINSNKEKPIELKNGDETIFEDKGRFKPLILKGLKLGTDVLPGIWSTIASILIIAIE